MFKCLSRSKVGLLSDNFLWSLQGSMAFSYQNRWMNLDNAVSSFLTEQTPQQWCKVWSNSHCFTVCTQDGRESHFACAFEKNFRSGEDCIYCWRMSIWVMFWDCLFWVLQLSIPLIFLFLVNCCFFNSVNIIEMSLPFLGCTPTFYVEILVHIPNTETTACVSVLFI